MKFSPTPEHMLFSRHDPEDPRLGEFVSTEALPGATGIQAPITLWGYADDEGIQINGGRIGAAEGPDRIRHSLYRMTPFRHWPRINLFHDRGNIRPSHFSLEERHALGREAVRQHYREDPGFLVTLGGGHDYGFPDGAGFLDEFVHARPKPLILNFDAHLDVRPVDRGLTSGTPFRRLIEQFGTQFELVAIGIQPQCNSPFHWEWAISQGIQILTLETIRNQDGPGGLQMALSECLDVDSKRPVWISLDMDVFSSREAPGCSATWPTGLAAEEVLRLLPWIHSNFSVKGMGIYEVSPPLDQDGKTAKLAALVIYQALNQVLRGQSENSATPP
ncbi:MAG: formimidoylglutamase [Bdellovibrio sp.]|nr:MAG: formimidoylglutamase [Bdellovibrio sp.]